MPLNSPRTSVVLCSCPDAEMEHASCADTRQLQRATIRSIQVLRPLGRGAYAQVQLVAVPVNGQLKLCAQKLLLLAPPPTPAAATAPPTDSSSSSSPELPSSCSTSPPPPSAPHLPPIQQLKPSSAGDFQRERSMHQLCTGCPFIVQVLAAKTAPATMLLLMQFAEHGSLAQAYQLAVPEGPTQRGAVSSEPCLCTPLLDAPLQQQHAAAAATAAAGAHELAVPIALLPPAGAQRASPSPPPPPAAAAVFVAASCCHPTPLAAAGAMFTVSCDQPLASVQQLQPQQQPQPGVPSAELEQQPQQQQNCHHHHQHHHHQQQQQQQLVCVPAAGQVVGAGGMLEGVARFYIGCVVLALEHMHARSLVHRDVKPQNVLLFSNGYVKLGDLGCCVALPPGQLASTRSGTAAYMAPEVAAAQPYGAPADMWSLGVTLLHLLEGCVPAWCAGQPLAGNAGSHQQVLSPRYSPELCCLLRSLLSVDAGARPTAATIQGAPWFSGFAWQQLRDQTLAAPPLAAAAAVTAVAAVAEVAVASG